MDVVFGFLAGVVAALFSVALINGRKVAARRRAVAVPNVESQATPSPVEPEPFPDEPEPLPVEPEPSAPPAISPFQRLHQLSEPLAALGEVSAHPRDVATNPLFREALEIFRNQVPLELVVDYAGGFNWMLASAACAGLSHREDREEASDHIRSFFPYMRPWPVYFALHYFKSIDSRPTGALLLHCPEYWADHPFIPALLRDYFASCVHPDSPPSFAGGLAQLTQAELAAVEALLRKIEHPVARTLLDEIQAFRGARLDREYLQTFGRFLDADVSRQLLIEHDAVKDQLAQAEASILRQPPRSVLVVGEPRSGKSTFLAMLAARVERQGWTVFEAGGPQLQAGQQYIGQLEERLSRITNELGAEKRVVWQVPDFLQLAASGTHKAQSASILDQVLPAITGGRVALISEITPAALTRVLQHYPGLRTAVDLIRLRPLSDPETKQLAADVAERLATIFHIRVDAGVLDTAAHLARHHLGEGQMPGALLDLLKLAAKQMSARGDDRLTRDDVLATISHMTGMPKEVLDERERVDLAELRSFFSARVIGQTEAVEAVVERIAMLKAGLTDATRPVGVFLLAGPTGTGKTELAKTLADYLFGSADRLIRLDMSELQSVDALRKLVGDPGGPDDQALTGRVRRQPFSVVLLDEFEKAHPNIWDLFLQVFDDGRLTDANGHTVDFRHCIIILTSNLGSTIKSDAGAGFVAQDQALSADRVRKAIHQSFRQEFINRLDRIIIFRALTRHDLRRIVEKELAQVLERRGLRSREWAVEWEASALEFLLDKGFSPAMGARPLKRAIDQHLLSPLAATLVEHRFPEGDQFLFVRSDGRALQVEFVDPDAPAEAPPRPEPPIAPASTPTIPRIMLHPSGEAGELSALSAELQRLESELAGDRWTSLMRDLASRMQRPDFWSQPDRRAILSRLEVMDRVKAALATAAGLARRLARPSQASRQYSRDLIARLATQLLVVAHGIEDALTDAPVEVVLAVQPVLDRGAAASVSAEWCDRLLGMYRSWAAERGARIDEVRAGSEPRPLLVLSGFGVSRLLSSEPGLHVLDYEDANESGRAVARVAVAATPAVLPEAAAEQHAALSAALETAPAASTVVRRYQFDPSPVVRDLRQGWRTGRVDLVFSGHFDLMGEIGAGAESRT